MANPQPRLRSARSDVPTPRKSAARRRPSRRLRAGGERDPLFNESVQKAFAILHAFGSERRALNLGEIAQAAGVTKSSAQRCTHTLERLGLLARDPRVRRWVLTPRTLTLADAYLSGHPLVEHATTYLVELNQATGESVSLSEPDDTDMVFVARFPSRKRFFWHMPVGRRLPMYCTASGRAFLSALPPADAARIVRRSALRPITPKTLTDPDVILEHIEAARRAGYAWSDQECYRGDVTIAAPVTGEDGLPIAAVNVSAPTSRWRLADLRSRFAPLLIETARAAAGGAAARLRA
jgi:IclR family pca regulon transcriptional regulator